MKYIKSMKCCFSDGFRLQLNYNKITITIKLQLDYNKITIELQLQ